LPFIVLGLVWAAPAGAQEPANPVPPCLDGQILPTSPPDEAPTAGQAHYAAAQLLLGQTSVARKCAPLYEEGGSSFLLELHEGNTLTPLPTVGVAGGGRFDFTLAGDGPGNALVVGPGVDLWATCSAREVVLAPTLDISLQQGTGTQFAWQVGLNLGAGYFCGRATDFGFPRLFPLFGLYTGLRF
jgi:hypothetical protein